MVDYEIVELCSWDRKLAGQIDALLSSEGLHRDKNLDYTCALLNNEGEAIATGSCFANTLRCLAVNRRYQGQGLLNSLVTHLIGYQHKRGNTHLFLYTKPDSACFFLNLGFFEIARVPDTLVFMENRRTGFSDYLRQLPSAGTKDRSAAIVMNANTFTLGHQYLTETAAAQCDALYLFVVSEECSVIPFPVRKDLVWAGIAHIPNVVLCDCGPYMISNATFPGYFMKNDEDVTVAQARLDLAVFSRICEFLGITRRFVGTEPLSRITQLYNQVMWKELPAYGIEVTEIPRKENAGVPISASAVRQAIKMNDSDALRKLVPSTTYDWVISEEAASVIEKIRRTDCVIHE